MIIIDEELVVLLEDRLLAVRATVEQLELMVANVRMANSDGEKYVVTDNLRRMPETIGHCHLRLGRLNAAVERAEEEASRVR